MKIQINLRRSLNNSIGGDIMGKSIRTFILTLSACTLMMLTGADAKDQLVSRPLKMAVQSQQVLNLIDYSVVAHAYGVSSHMGQVTMDTSGTLGDPMFYGTITAANGDIVYWEWDPTSTIVTITGGTGRFEDAQGEFFMEIALLGEEFDPVAQTITRTFIWTASGTIAY